MQQGTDSSTVRNCAASEFLLAVANTLDEGTTSYSERAVAVAAAARAVLVRLLQEVGVLLREVAKIDTNLK